MATVESPSSSTGTCSPSTSLSVRHNTTSHPALTVTRPSCSPTPASAPFLCRTPATSRSPTSSAASSRRSSSSSSSPSLSARPDGLFITSHLLAPPTSGSARLSSNDSSISTNAHSIRASGLERARAQSLFSPIPDRSNYSFQDQENVIAMALHRPSLPTNDTSSVRSAQLALLAEQAKMASIGTSNLRVARAHSLVVVDAMRSVAEQSINSLSQISREAEEMRDPVSPQASSSNELPQPQEDSPSTPSRQPSSRLGMQIASSSAASKLTDGEVSPTAMVDPSDSAQPMVASELAWQEVVTSRDFLPSASHLAQMFRAQQQDRKAWAGQALEQQRRRWTMNHHDTERPAISQLKQRHSDETVATAGKRRPNGQDESNQDTSRGERQHKKRRLAESQEERRKKDRRVSFATGTAGGLVDADDEMEDAETLSGSSSPAPRASKAGDASDASTVAEPEVEDGALVRSSARRSLSAEARPQLLENVLTSFASLLESRQEACAGLAELAKHGNEIVEAAAAVSASRANSRACSRASSPKASKPPGSGLLSTNALDSSALDTDTSDEEGDETVGDDSLESVEAASTVSSSSLREGDIAERSPEQQGTDSPAAQKPEQ